MKPLKILFNPTINMPKYKGKVYRMPGVLSNNVHQEPVEEKNHSESIGILSHHIPFDIANSYPE